ncbi:MAG: hypothetical protein K2N61_08310 [Lachnospiraceae bacterium]|nr:hypothetical protein [Lachnospiraceae bacterium]
MSKQTIIVKLDAQKMENPDLDIRYKLPDRIEEVTKGRISDNGYDYLSDTVLGIWLEADNAEEDVKEVIELIKKEKFLKNDLSQTAEIVISEKETAEVEECRRVYPEV